MPETHWTVKELKERGWTEMLVQRLLGKPDATRRNPMSSAHPIRLYLRSRVMDAERSAQWPALQERAEIRKQAAAQGVKTKRAQLLAYVDALTISVPVLTQAEVVCRACSNYNAFHIENAMERSDYRFTFASEDSTPAFLERISVNYLRHCLSRYETELERLFGKVGVQDAYAALNWKVYQAIAAAYPALSAECHRQIQRKFLSPPKEEENTTEPE